MTLREIYVNLLTELSKTLAPSLLLSDFNHFANKAIQMFVNKRYNIYDTLQLTTDDLRVLNTTVLLPVTNNEVVLPDDYLHLLNCICIYQMNKNYKCYKEGDEVMFPAKRLTADAYPVIMTNYYNRPQFNRPYFYINNIAESNLTPNNTNVDLIGTYNVAVNEGADIIGNSNFKRHLTLSDLWNGSETTVSTVNKLIALRYGNPSKIRMEIKWGDDPAFNLIQVQVGYLKTPLYVKLTLELINTIEDTSQIMEFPDYVCLEILNELTTLVMSNIADPRLLSNSVVSQSIGGSQLTQPQ